jgi:hypothetical protein
MTANQETHHATVKTAAKTFATTVAAAETTRQGTVEAAWHQVGYLPGFPTGNATFVAAVAAANATKVASLVAAEVARQGTVAAAVDLIRSQGELP